MGFASVDFSWHDLGLLYFLAGVWEKGADLGQQWLRPVPARLGVLRGFREQPLDRVVSGAVTVVIGFPSLPLGIFRRKFG